MKNPKWKYLVWREEEKKMCHEEKEEEGRKQKMKEGKCCGVGTEAAAVTEENDSLMCLILESSFILPHTWREKENISQEGEGKCLINVYVT